MLSPNTIITFLMTNCVFQGAMKAAEKPWAPGEDGEGEGWQPVIWGGVGGAEGVLPLPPPHALASGAGSPGFPLAPLPAESR